jgi:beta-glucosidase
MNPIITRKDKIVSSDFGKSFIWGVSTSALQTEGHHKADGKGPNIWDEFVEEKKIKNQDKHYHSSGFYQHFKKDIDTVKELGITNFRFSISWARIIPDGYGEVNPKGLDFYMQVIDYCIESNIVPWITLYHWDLPLALERKGGWVNREILLWFEAYVRVCINAYKHKVKHWMVLNEPLVFTGAGYFAGIHAPGKKHLKNFLPAAHHAALCQALGYRVIKEIQPNSHVGTTFSCSHITPYSIKEKDLKAAHRMDALLNRLFIEPSLGLGYPIESLPVLNKMKRYMNPGDEALLKADFDFIGIQIYTREVVANSFFTPYVKAKIVPVNERRVHHTKMSWEVYPASIYEIIKKVSVYKGVKKIIVTENGASFNDEVFLGRVQDLDRIHFLEKYLEQVHKAFLENHKIEGYFVWSLTDNFEWAEGYEQRFGLVYIDYDSKERIIKNSGFWYREFLQS